MNLGARSNCTHSHRCESPSAAAIVGATSSSDMVATGDVGFVSNQTYELRKIEQWLSLCSGCKRDPRLYFIYYVTDFWPTYFTIISLFPATMLLLVSSIYFIYTDLTDAASITTGSVTELNTRIAPIWVSDPAGRGILGLFYSCVFTILLCIYTAIHLNVPTIQPITSPRLTWYMPSTSYWVDSRAHPHHQRRYFLS